MKRTLFFALTLVAIAYGGPASAQVFYQFPDARVVPRETLVAGSFFGAGENDRVRFGGYGRLGIAAQIDVGVEAELDFVNGDAMGGAGLDVKFGIFPLNSALPFDLSLDAGLGFISGNGITVLQAPFGGVVSTPFKLDTGTTLVPFLGIYLLVVDTDIDRGALPSISDTDIDVELRGGLLYELEGRLDLFGTIHLGRDALVSIGVNLKI